MINKVELYLDAKWQDVTAYLQKNDVVRQNRCDDAFAIGSLQLRYNRSTNIPPYTPLRINSSELWFSKSTCRRYLTKENYYIHNVDLLDLTAGLSCYILGSKSFSVTGTHTKDYEKLQIIAVLMQQKYGVIFDFGSCHFLNKQQDFTFGPGTTVFDALTEMVTSYNGVKVKVVSYDPATNTYTINFSLDSSQYRLREEGILDEYYTQDSDTYGSILESEMTNVIDRSTTTIAAKLTSRTEDFRMDVENCCIMLPTRCEEIVDFGISSDVGKLVCEISLSHKYTSVIMNHLPNLSSKHPKPFREWRTFVRDTTGFSPLDVFLNLVKKNYGIEEESILNSSWYQIQRSDVSDHPSTYVILVPDNEDHAIKGLPSKWSLKNSILPKNRWLLLDDREKPKYCYYESGSNKIEGMDSYYKNDFWNNLIGNTVKPFLNNINYSDEIEESLNDPKDGEIRTTVIKCSYELNFTEKNSKSFLYSYWVEYYPIMDLCVKNDKKVISNNEATIKPFARSYDKTSNYIEFDRLIESLQITNDMMGLPEGTIEYKLAVDEEAPKAFQCINRNGKEWTIASVVLTSSLNKETAVINLVYDYNKVADAIGVKTQYNETKNPLNNIIDRPILWEADGSGIPGICNECWAKILIAGRKLYKRCAVSEKNGVVYAYLEALDQYSFDKQAIIAGDSQTSELFYCNDVPYCDGNNEASCATVILGLLPNLTREESLNLPLYQGSNFIELINMGEKQIYKDSRERIIFTIKLTNCTIISYDSIAKATMRHLLTVSVDSGVASWTVTRLSSEVGMPLGNLSQGAYIYEGDVIEASATAKSGYGMPEGDYVKFKVSKVNVHNQPLEIIFNSIEKFAGVDPEILEAKLTQDSYSATWYFSYKIKNNNNIGVHAIVNVYVGDVHYCTFTHDINDGDTIVGGFSDAPEITSIDVEFKSSALTGNLAAQSQVEKIN